MRLLIYGTLVIFAGLLLADINIGLALEDHENAEVRTAIEYLHEKSFSRDARLAAGIADAEGLRSSRFFTRLAAIGDMRGYGFSYYAYTPIFSKSRIFLGKSFWEVGTVGRSSVLIHEIAHIKRHQRRALRGIPRHLDEAEAYLRQYLTYRKLELSPIHEDGVVYWDMMIGLREYSLPVYPEYAGREDIRWAMGLLDELESR